MEQIKMCKEAAIRHISSCRYSIDELFLIYFAVISN
jgi:hypothetical protein